MARDYNLEKRKYVIAGIAISVVLIFIVRLFVLQILSEDYKKNADSNAFLNKIQNGIKRISLKGNQPQNILWALQNISFQV